MEDVEVVTKAQSNGNATLPKRDPLIELGGSGLKRKTGLVDEEFLPQLRGDKAQKVYREMLDNDPVVGSIMFFIRMLIRQVNWHVEPFGEEDSDLENVEFVEQCMEDMNLPWSAFIVECLSFLPYGWSFFEIVYKQRNGDQEGNKDVPSSNFSDGKYGWRKFAVRPHETRKKWLFDDGGGIQAFVQKLEKDEVVIPIDVGLLFRTEISKGSPEGRSALRTAYRPWWFKKRFEELEAIGFDRNLTGLPVMEVPPEWFIESAYSEQLAIAEKTVRDLRNDEQAGLVMPAIYDEAGHKLTSFSLVASPGSKDANIDNAISRKNREIAMTVLADVILLGHERVGTQALAVEKNAMFTSAITAWIIEIQDVVNAHAIKRLFRVNGLSTERLPLIKADDIEALNLAEVGKYIATLAGSGMPLFPDIELENYLRRLAGLPEAPEEEEGLEGEEEEDEDITEDDVIAQLFGKSEVSEVEKKRKFDESKIARSILGQFANKPVLRGMSDEDKAKNKFLRAVNKSPFLQALLTPGSRSFNNGNSIKFEGGDFSDRRSMEALIKKLVKGGAQLRPTEEGDDPSVQPDGTILIEFNGKTLVFPGFDKFDESPPKDWQRSMMRSLGVPESKLPPTEYQVKAAAERAERQATALKEKEAKAKAVADAKAAKAAAAAAKKAAASVSG